ncbi:TPA: hypothetical protein QHU17_004060 [Enterobacter hormaechei subsp. xiangfangensis]|nr:hypothetical protein [Enterobacter hormaechei subsp. xiangfangensis]
MKSGKAGETDNITAVVNAIYGTDRVEWSCDAEFTVTGGKTEPAGDHCESLKITYPSFNYAGTQTTNVYHISSVASDTKGNKSNHGVTEIRVSEAETNATGIADGKATADVSSTKAGIYTVTDTVNGKDINQSLQLMNLCVAMHR